VSGIATRPASGITFDGVSFAYGHAGGAVLSGVDWRIDDGDFVVLAGESGSGKSTLLRCLNGLVPHFSGGRFGGSVTVAGLDTRHNGPRALSGDVGFVFQDPDAQRVATIVEDELAFGMEQLGVPPLTMRTRVEEVLDLLGIAALRHRDLDTLSGGERQRVAVAAALTLQPRILVLDEPTSQLDPWGAEDVIAAVERLNHDLGLTVVMSEHRLERVIAVADRMRVLRLEGPFDGPPRDVLQALDDEMLPPIARLGRAMEWFPLPMTVKEGRSAARLAGFRPPEAIDERASPSGVPVVVLDRVSAGHGRATVLAEISLEVRPGEIVAVMGRNGSGKTTLLRTIMGFHRPTRGRVVVNGEEAGQRKPGEPPARTGYLPQRPGAILFNDSVRAELAFTERFHRGHARNADELLTELDLAHLRDRNPRDLSTGEQERAALAAVLVANPRLVLLDEPTRGMDYRRKHALSRFLRNRRAEGIATMLATHDVELVAETATRVVLLGEGEIVADGSPRDVLSGSLTYSTQINKLLGGRFLTVADALPAANMEERVSGPLHPMLDSHSEAGRSCKQG
jgi:energy-coupling factor transporter ATP-binding protein EcfA2